MAGNRPLAGNERAVAAQTAKDILASKLVLVTGKGGTGKTALAASLATLGAASGRRVLLAEIDSQRPALTSIFGIEPTFQPQEVRPNLAIANLTWQDALEAFLTKLVPSRRIVRLVLSNRMVGRFLDFTPGSQEIVTLSALAEQVEHYDLVVADLPASGHAFSLLDIPRSALGLFRSGPIRARATELRNLITSMGTHMVLVALPEEMVVNETIETHAKLDQYELLARAPTVFLNRATLPTFTEAERGLLQHLGEQDLTETQREYVRAGRWEDELEQATAESRARLQAALPGATLLIPPAAPGGSSRDIVQSMSVHLGRLVGLTRRELEWE